MSQRVECSHCGRVYGVDEPDCPGCGASLPRSALLIRHEVTSVAHVPSGPAVVGNDLAEVIAGYADVDEVRTPPIPAKKLRTATKSMVIPPNETVFALIDATVFGSNKVGFAIGSAGLYWYNDWTTSSTVTFLTWPELAMRSVHVDGSSIEVGSDDRIDVAALGDDDKRERLAQLLRDVIHHLS